MNRLAEALAAAVNKDTVLEMELPSGDKWTQSRGQYVYTGGDQRVPPAKTKDGKKAGKKVTFKKKDGSEGERDAYSDEWAHDSADSKFSRISAITRRADDMEKTIRAEMNTDTKSIKKAAATAIATMFLSGMRVGGGDVPGKPGKTNGVDTFGASTLQQRHVTIKGDEVTFKYIGKAGVPHLEVVKDKEFADAIRVFMDGKDSAPKSKKLLFTIDEKKKSIMTRRHIANFMKEFDPEFKNHDLRTHKAAEAASEKALEIIDRYHKKDVIDTIKSKEPGKEPTKAALMKVARKITNEIGDHVSGVLGNTRSAALGNYVHPGVIDHVLDEIGLPRLPPKKKKATTEGVEGEVNPNDAGSRFPVLSGLFGRDFVVQWLGIYGDDDNAEEEALASYVTDTIGDDD